MTPASEANCTSEATVELACRVAELFPPGVVAVQVRGTVSPQHLFKEEREFIARAVDKRAQEFSAGRRCARAALSALGYPEVPLLPGADRAPRWPPGVTGSISHTDGYCVAVVSPTSRCVGLGIDAEHKGQLRPSLWPSVFRPEEIALLETMPEAERSTRATVLFTAKEAFYKCQYAVTRARLDFEDVMIQVTGDTFHVTLCNGVESLLPAVFSADGRFTRDADVIVSGIAIQT